MKIIDNINSLLGDDLKGTVQPGDKLKIAASCFSIYAYEALKDELADIDELEFIFTSPTFVPSNVTDKLKMEFTSLKSEPIKCDTNWQNIANRSQIRNWLAFLSILAPSIVGIMMEKRLEACDYAKYPEVKE